jgi:hypothetical protein
MSDIIKSLRCIITHIIEYLVDIANMHNDSTM